ALDTPSTRAIAPIGKQAWFALMNRKSRTAACRSPEQTRPRLLKEYRAPVAAACSHAAAGSTHHARMRSDQEPPPPGGPRFGQPGRPTREWSGRLAQTRGQDRQDYDQHGRGRPSVGETPANTVDVFLASVAPLARDSGCPPNRVNPKQHLQRPALRRPLARPVTACGKAEATALSSVDIEPLFLLSDRS